MLRTIAPISRLAKRLTPSLARMGMGPAGDRQAGITSIYRALIQGKVKEAETMRRST